MRFILERRKAIINNPLDAMKHKIGFVTEDRKIDRLIPKSEHYRQYDYAENVALFREFPRCLL